MAATIWAIVDETERDQWSVDPLMSVGPLQFGMSHGDVLVAVAERMQCSASDGRWPGRIHSAIFNRHGGRGLGAALGVSYDEAGELACVAVGARSGPQVGLAGMRLVGRVPSEVEDEFAGFLEARGLDLCYSQHGDPGSESLGLVLRAQRAGDVVLSRPVFVARTWAERCWDTMEGRIPRKEWQTVC